MEIKDPRNQQGLPLTVSVNGIVADSNGNIAITSRENISFTSSDLTAEHKYTVTNTKVVDIAIIDNNGMLQLPDRKQVGDNVEIDFTKWTIEGTWTIQFSSGSSYDSSFEASVTSILG